MDVLRKGKAFPQVGRQSRRSSLTESSVIQTSLVSDGRHIQQRSPSAERRSETAAATIYSTRTTFEYADSPASFSARTR
jgi:hypothetical protein